MTFGVDTRGIYPIAATPFNADMSVDYNSIDRLTEFYQDAGATGMTILGILGEAQKLEPEESLAIARRVISRSRVPVVVGASNPSFAAMRRLADRHLFQSRCRGDRPGRPLGSAGLPSDVVGDPVGADDLAHHEGTSLLRHA
jgi:hypothetical protein